MVYYNRYFYQLQELGHVRLQLDAEIEQGNI
jgi:hypothetical protein